ncbi:MAG: hypothetical protein AWU55_865 [Halomonadaceae bacterium T82-2]|nr:MAG: hypothetical protein AWU55_865 [Halomonadaceae bacterium T82-2]
MRYDVLFPPATVQSAALPVGWWSGNETPIFQFFGELT